MNERYETFTVLINRINRNVRRIKNKEMAEYGLRSSHISCLYYLYTGDNIMTSADLCERCEEDKATISRSLSYLEANGYLCYRSKNTKRYNSPLILTEFGFEAGKKIADRVNSVLDEIQVFLTEEERVSFYRSLSTISESLETLANKNCM